MDNIKPLTFKEYEIKFQTYILEHLENFKKISEALHPKDKLDFEQKRKLTINKSELIALIESELKRTKSILLEPENAELGRIIDANSKEIIKSIQSLSDELTNGLYKYFVDPKSHYTDENLRIKFADRTHFTNEDQDKLGKTIIEILIKRLHFEYLKSELAIVKNDEPIPREAKPLVHWTRDKVDFYKLVYSLYHSKAIDDGKGEITKIMKDLAQVFGVELAKSWQSSSSKNKDYGNAGYNGIKLFEDLEKGYLEYVEGLDKKKKKGKI